MALTDPNLGLTYGWTLGESGWHTGMDANLKRLGALVGLSVKDRDLTTPPASPAEGDRYIVPAGATGAWAGKTDQIAVWIGGAWEFYTPKIGWLCYIEDEEVLSVFKADGWSAGVAGGGTTLPVDDTTALVKDSDDDTKQVRMEVGGLTTGTTRVITIPDRDITLMGTDESFLATWIQGLQLVWVSGSALTITTGSAWIPSLGRVYQVASDIELTGLSFSANTWYHVYLYDNSGTPAAELSTTEPAAPYAGTARTKTGDTSRRYLGSVRSNGDATPIMFNFLHSGQFIKYRNQQDFAPFRLLSAGTATTETVVSASAVVPVTARIASIRVVNLADVPMRTGTSDDSASGPPTMGIVGVAPGAQAFLDHPLDSSQAMTYWMVSEPGSGGAYIDVYGYVLER